MIQLEQNLLISLGQSPVRVSVDKSPCFTELPSPLGDSRTELMGLEVKDEGPFSHSSKLLAEFKFLFGLGVSFVIVIIVFSCESLISPID